MRRDRDILAHRAVRLWGAWQSARRGRAIARTELWQMTAARDVFVTFTKEAETERDRLAEQVKRVLESAHWALTTSADDWSVTFGKAWLYGMFVGWCCEEAHEHDEICGGAHDTLGDLARRGAWPPAAIERLRVLRSDVRALDGTEATP